MSPFAASFTAALLCSVACIGAQVLELVGIMGQPAADVVSIAFVVIHLVCALEAAEHVRRKQEREVFTQIMREVWS